MTQKQSLRSLLMATLLTPLAASGCGPGQEFEIPTSKEAPLTSALSSPATELGSERRGIGIESPLGTAGLQSALHFPIDDRRSLAVTDVAIVKKFSMGDVMDRISNGKGLALFKQWWGDQKSPTCTGSLNGFSMPCRTAEPLEADTTNPFGAGDDGYIALGLFNRFDLAPRDGSNCGEYRIVFARKSGMTNASRRNLIIFEAILPNPTPALGLEGCRPVARFWAGLSNIADVEERADALKEFYFTGLPGFEPVIAASHFTRSTGQVRTNQFMQSTWSLREFKLKPEVCFFTRAGTICNPARLVQVTVKTNPHPSQLQPKPGGGLNAFQTHFITQIPALMRGDINTFNYEVPDNFNAGDSDPSTNEGNFVVQVNLGDFKNAIDAAIPPESKLTAQHLLNRATALTCAGCHEVSTRPVRFSPFSVHPNLARQVGPDSLWPPSLGFVHVSEQQEDAATGPRFQISPALVSTFLPHRRGVLEGFLRKLDSCVNTTVEHQLTIQPAGAAGKDASLASVVPNSNGGSSATLSALAWNFGPVRATSRGLLQFNLRGVPPSFNVKQATLRLFAETSDSSFPGHTSLNGSNAGFLARVTSQWDESTVTWSNQPRADMSQTVAIPPSTSATQDYSLDVTSFTQGMVASPATNNGFLLQLVSEQPSNDLTFHSSDATDASRRPALQITVSTNICKP